MEIGYFDQIHRELDTEKTIAENVGNGKEYIKIDGKDRHIIGYLRNFLFSPKRAMTPVKALSGGEKNRVLLAKLFTQPSNLLILDEPTNDLDIEMLEVLEEQLVEYKGTLIIVSHDRQFLDNVVTSVLVFEAEGQIQEYLGGYTNWENHGKELKITDIAGAQGTLKGESVKSTQIETRKVTPAKLSYKLQRELDLLPELIEKIEAELAVLQAQTTVPEFYLKPFAATQPLLDEMKEKQLILDSASERWLELEATKG